MFSGSIEVSSVGRNGVGVVVGGSGVSVRCAVSVCFWVGLGVGVKTGIFVGDDSKLIVRVADEGMLSSIISVKLGVSVGGCDAVILCISAHADNIHGINKNTKTGFKVIF